MTIHVVNVTYTVFSAILICISMTVAALRPVSWNDPLDLAELHSFRLVYFKHKEIFLVVFIVSRWSYGVLLCPFTGLTLSGPLLHGL